MPGSLRAPLALPAALALLAAACVSEHASSEVTNGILVGTQYDPGASFGSYRTFDIPSKVALVQDGATTYQAAPSILGEITANLEQRGYVLGRVIDPESPPGTATSDLGLAVAVLLTTKTSTYPCDWGAWWGYPSYGCYYPWYWVTSFTTGTLLVEMIDLKNAPGGGSPNLSAIWVALAYAITPGPPYDTGIGVEAVDRAFAQSPYLHSP